MNKEFALPTAKCIACGYVWTPRVRKPVMCPNCKTPFWDKPRHSEKEYVVKKVTSINLESADSGYGFHEVSKS